MRRRIAPWRAVDPSPAPWLDPRPAAGTVGRPIDRHHGRIPDRTIRLSRAPGAVAIELFIAGHFRGKITRRDRCVVALVSRGAPVIELIGVIAGMRVAHADITARDFHSIAGAQREIRPRALEARCAAKQADCSAFRLAPGIDPQLGRRGQQYQALRRLQFKIARRVAARDAYAGAALGQIEFQVLIVELSDFQFRIRVQAHRR